MYFNFPAKADSYRALREIFKKVDRTLKVLIIVNIQI